MIMISQLARDWGDVYRRPKRRRAVSRDRLLNGREIVFTQAAANAIVTAGGEQTAHPQRPILARLRQVAAPVLLDTLGIVNIPMECNASATGAVKALNAIRIIDGAADGFALTMGIRLRDAQVADTLVANHLPVPRDRGGPAISKGRTHGEQGTDTKGDREVLKFDLHVLVLHMRDDVQQLVPLFHLICDRTMDFALLNGSDLYHTTRLL